MGEKEKRDWKHRNNRYWRSVQGSGHVCDKCGIWGSYLGMVKRKSDGLILCRECYEAGAT